MRDFLAGLFIASTCLTNSFGQLGHFNVLELNEQTE